MLRLAIPLRPCPKARPRVVRGRAFMPKPYQDWRKAFVQSVKTQWHGEAFVGDMSLSCEFFHKGKARSDGDNLLGAVMDALQDAGVYANDKAIKRGRFRIIEDTGLDPSIVVSLTGVDGPF